MKKQRVVLGVVLGVVLAVVLPASARAQAAPAPGAGALDAVAREIRLMRQALEKQSSATARAQLLIGRLTLQDQRTARARQAVDRLEGELTAAERERDHLHATGRELSRALEQTTDPERRQVMESELRNMRERAGDAQAGLSRAETRLAQARQALDAETSRYDELESWLADLDRQLRGGE